MSIKSTASNAPLPSLQSLNLLQHAWLKSSQSKVEPVLCILICNPYTAANLSFELNLRRDIKEVNAKKTLSNVFHA